MKKFLGILIAIILISAISVGVIIFAGQNEFKVEFGGKSYTGENKIVLPSEGTAKFKVKGVETYEYVFVPNVDEKTDFSYTVDGESFLFSQLDLNKVIKHEVKDGVLIIDCSQDFSLKGVLESYYQGSNVEVENHLDFPYVLKFTSEDKTITFYIATGFTITLDKTEIYF